MRDNVGSVSLDGDIVRDFFDDGVVFEVDDVFVIDVLCDGDGGGFGVVELFV